MTFAELERSRRRLEWAMKVAQVDSFRARLVLSPLVKRLREIVVEVDGVERTLERGRRAYDHRSKQPKNREELMDIERAVQINASLNRKRALLTQERGRLIEQIQPIAAQCERASAVQARAESGWRSIGALRLVASDAAASEERST